MPTTVSGPVRMPDGSTPTHGRVVFTRRLPLAADVIVPATAIEAIITPEGTISVALEGESSGTRYGVVVEQWVEAESKLISSRLPDIVVSGAGSGPVGDFATITPATRDTYNLHRGDSAALPVTLLDANDLPADVRDSTITASLSGQGVEAGIPVAKVDAARGLVEVSIPASLSRSLNLGVYIATIRIVVGARVRTVRGLINIT